MWKLYWGRIYFQTYLHGCNQDAVPQGLLDKGLHFFIGCWSQATLSSLPHRPLVASCFIRASKREKPEGMPEREKERISKVEATVFYSFLLEVMSPHFCHIPFVRSKSPGWAHTQMKGITQRHTYQKARSMRVIIEDSVPQGWSHKGERK